MVALSISLHKFCRAIREGITDFIFQLKLHAPILFHAFSGSLKWGKDEVERARVRSLRLFHYVHQVLMDASRVISSLIRSSAPLICATHLLYNLTLPPLLATCTILSSMGDLADICCKRNPKSCSSIHHIEPSPSSIWTGGSSIA
jgi:hypothetical protein